MFASGALSAVDFPRASSLALACHKSLQGTADGVGDSSGIDRLTEYPGFDECGTVEKASPKCREAEFCELRVDGVIGSSPRVAETGDTTFLARAYTAHPRRCDGSSSPEKEMLLLSERGRRGKRRQGARC
jgi:hypothetical protein